MQTEKHVFEQASNHPFLVGLHSSFQTESRYIQTGVCNDIVVGQEKVVTMCSA